jgi:Domain of unknown function (DUF4157)
MAETIAPSQTPAQSSSVRESVSPRGPETDVQPVAVPLGQNLPGILRRAKVDMGLLAPVEILTLQRTIGNQGVLRLLAGARQHQRNGEALQAKLTIGAPDDVYEKEADSVADQVMSNSSTLLRQGAAAGAAGSDDDPEKRNSPQAIPELRRKCACGDGSEQECPDCRMKRVAVQRLSPGGDAGLEVPSMVEDVLATPGQPLAESARRTLEPGFGHDFSHVRVHEGSKAAESAAAVNAVAYTVGNHIVFGEGQYATGTTAGQHLLAHELTHTIQQSGGRPLGSHLARLAQVKSAMVQRDADTLDQDYNTALQSGNWQDAAEKLNGFNKQDIQSRLSQLTPDQVAKLHQGALNNPRVGPDSQVAQLTAATPANQTPASAPAAGQTAVGGPEHPANGATTPSGAGAGPNSSTATGLIVEEDASNLSPGQMKKSDFLRQLRQPVSDAVQGASQGEAGQATGSAAIEPWFQHYAGQGAQELESAIQSSVPGAGKVADAGSYIPLVAAHVASTVGDSSTTGTVPPGLPAGLPGVSAATGGAVSGAAQSAPNATSNIGGMLFKLKRGGARVADDPRAIQAQLGGGEPLEGSLQGRMNSVFGYDFSGVRVHKDNQAAQLSADLNARAFTIGRNVTFGAGEYQPGTPIGDALIAHELAHVVQQGKGSARLPLQKGETGTGKLEEDADVSAVRAVASLWGGVTAGLATLGHNAIPALKSGLKLQSCSRKTAPLPTFDQYRDRFNTLWNTAPFNTMGAAASAFDPSLDSRGPRTSKARAIFTKILTDDPTMATAYGSNTGGIRTSIDTYIGPAGLNLNASPRLDALKNAFTAYPKPVPPASYPALRASVATAAGALTPDDREAVEHSNDWQMLINDYVPDEAHRIDIRSLISPPPAAAPPAVAPPGAPAPAAPRATPAQRAHFLTVWQPHLMFSDGGGNANWALGATVRYHVGAQNFYLNAVLPAAETNPGLTLYVSAQILRGAAALFAPPPQTEFPADQNASAQLALPIVAPAAVPPGGDPLTFQVSILEPGAAGALTTISTKSLNVSVLSEIVYTQAQAEAAATADDAYLRDATPGGILGKMTAQGGVQANVAAAIAAGKIILRPMTKRHDSAAYVVTATHAANPMLEGYFIGTTYADSTTMVVGAAALTPDGRPHEIWVNRTSDVSSLTKRGEDSIIMLIVHESVHHMDVRPAAGTPLERYKTEFRAYWMDGRYGSPDSPTCVPPAGNCLGTAYDQTMPPPGPKSPRARAIFDLLYGSSTYDFVRPAYDNNTSGFREQVDNYLIPDGINLIVSVRLDRLRDVIETWPGTGFPAFRTSVQGYMGIGPAPPAGVLTAPERHEVSSNRSWRDLVERKVVDATQQGQIKSDLGIPV